MDLTEITIALVAIYGAGLSTYTLVSNRKDNKRHVRVKLSNGFLPVGPEIGALMLLLEATNPGNRTVILNSMCIRLPNGKDMVFLEPNSNVSFPHALEEGKSCLVWTPINEFINSLRTQGLKGNVKLKAFYRDQIGTKYWSKQFKLNVNN